MKRWLIRLAVLAAAVEIGLWVLLALFGVSIAIHH